MAVARYSIVAVRFAMCVVLVASCKRSAPTDRARPEVGVAPAPRARMAHLVRVTGDVRVKRAGSTQWLTVDTGFVLGPEDTVQAMENGGAQLSIEASGATVTLDPSTTIQLPRPASEPITVTGSLVVRVSATTDPAEVRLRLPPGVLVLRAEPNRQPVVEASVDVSPTRSSVEVRVGRATVQADAGGEIPIDSHQWVTFRQDGSIDQAGSVGLTPTLQLPEDGARVRTTGSVELTWEALDRAESYVISISSNGVTHRLEAKGRSVKTRFESGDYTWFVQGRRGEEVWPPSTPRSLHVDVDDRPPILVLTEPADHARANGPIMRFVGRSEPSVTVEVGTSRARADDRGNFALDVPISHGLTNLVIKARDDLGNERRVTRSVVWD